MVQPVAPPRLPSAAVAEALLDRSSWWESPRLAGLVSVAAGLLAVGICCFQLAYTNVLHGVLTYDDGVYFGSAIYLIHGIVPYRDYVFVAPPGITLLMTPFALLTHVTSSNEALALARVFTAVVVGANAMLAGLVVRHRGVAASLAAGTALAIFPSAFFADNTVLLEPYLVFFCLLGVVLLFQNGNIASPRRALLAGLALGFGGTVKLWAVIPFVIAAAFCIPLWRRAIVPLVGGAVIAFGVVCLPFFVLAPTAFFKDTIWAQATRATSGAVFTTGDRFLLLTGLGAPLGIHASRHGAIEIALGAAALFGLVFLVALAMNRSSRLDWFAFATMIATAIATIVPAAFYDHYGYFVAPFVAIVFGLVVRYVLEAVMWVVRQVAGGSYVSVDFAARTGLTIVIAALLVAGTVTAVKREAKYTRVWFAAIVANPGPAIAATVPKGVCVVTDMSSAVISGNRFWAAIPGCPTVLDSFGTWLVADPSHPPLSHEPPDPALVTEWRAWFGQADYVVLGNQSSFRVPWTPALWLWFHRTFVSVGSPGGVAIYRRSSSAALTTARLG